MNRLLGQSRLIRLSAILLSAAFICTATIAQNATVNLEGLDAYFEQAHNDWPVPGFSISGRGPIVLILT